MVISKVVRLCRAPPSNRRLSHSSTHRLSATTNPSSTRILCLSISLLGHANPESIMGWWKADPVEPSQPNPSPPTASPAPSSKIPSFHPPVAGNLAEADACPVDSKTREIWLQQAKKQRELQSQLKTQVTPPPPAAPAATPTVPTFTSTTAAQSTECSSDRISQNPTPQSITVPVGRATRTLSQDREVSTIPRAQLQTPTAVPSNSEQETGADKKSGNWIYPSETQFFSAVLRKSATTTSPEELASSISSIIPIHNAVNERAWHLIKQWEGDTSKKCGGPKLLSFQGLGAGALSPRARWNTFWGAREPFDRHDWIVERCNGEQVEYVIDFYQGKEREGVDPRRAAQELNFYLDVRPKLNSAEGIKMRAYKAMGWA